MNNDTITLDELYQGRAAVLKNKEFFSAKQYIEPFVERMSAITNDFIVKVKRNDTISLNGEIENQIFNRVWIQAILPEKYNIDNHQETISMIYGIDVKRPTVSIYKGYLNSACLNLTMFNPEWFTTQELVPGEAFNYAAVKNCLEYTNDFQVKLDYLKNNYLETSNKKEQLGIWIDNILKTVSDNGFGKVKLSPNIAIEAYKQLYLDKESSYYQNEAEEVSLFNVYNSFTQVISEDKRDILTKPQKTLLLNDILNLQFN